MFLAGILWVCAVPIGVSAIYYITPILLNSFQQNPMDYRALWSARGEPDYQIVVETGSPPAPPIAWALTVQHGQITQQSIMACDHPSQEYPAEDCNWIRQYYSWMGKYTIAQLFDIADEGIHTTQRSLLKCNLLTWSGFHSFPTVDAMWSAAQTCQNYLQSSDLLYTVQYDPDYGYPKTIVEYMLGCCDGGGDIEVKDFQVIR